LTVKSHQRETTSEIPPVVHLDENMVGMAFVPLVDYTWQVVALQK